jgi:hypothetical protein
MQLPRSYPARSTAGSASSQDRLQHYHADKCVLIDFTVPCAGAIAVDDRCSSVDAVLGSGSDNQASPLSVGAAATSSNGVLLIPNPALQLVRKLAG